MSTAFVTNDSPALFPRGISFCGIGETGSHGDGQGFPTGRLLPEARQLALGRYAATGMALGMRHPNASRFGGGFRMVIHRNFERAAFPWKQRLSKASSFVRCPLHPH